ncbi:uncharacterized protein LOC142177606 [Nicotiana tabacum]|uniref:Uncharacterized protein LOC142177606 n=1 Tax=Nicotiana tabacum TaxID=4097 RepID=A0AC58U0I5_TOBAC
MYFDGAVHRGRDGAGEVFITYQGEVLAYSFMLTQLCSNNVSEYQALILGLEMAVEIKRIQLQVFGDSQLVVDQLLGSYDVKKSELRPYHDYGKFTSKCEGPYVVQEAYSSGAYKLVDTDGMRIGHINGKLLKNYYP